MYSRNFKGRNVRNTVNVSGMGSSANSGSTGRYSGNESSGRIIVPPSYGGTLYISATPKSSENNDRKSDTDIRNETVEKDSGNSDNSVASDGYRTVMYNGEPYVPDEIGMHGSSHQNDVKGRGGHPMLDGSGELRFKGMPGRRVGDRKNKNHETEKDLRMSGTVPSFYSGSGFDVDNTESCEPGMNLKAFLDRMPPVDDIILIALIITLLGGRGDDAATDDVLIVILAVLLLFGKEKE